MCYGQIRGSNSNTGIGLSHQDYDFPRFASPRIDEIELSCCIDVTYFAIASFPRVRRSQGQLFQIIYNQRLAQLDEADAESLCSRVSPRP